MRLNGAKMTAHELARALLELPDVLVVIPFNHSDTGCTTPLVRVIEEEAWGNPWRRAEYDNVEHRVPCIVLWDEEESNAGN